jgi:sortase A
MNSLKKKQFKPNWLIVIGLFLLVWGLGGAYSVFQSEGFLSIFFPEEEEVSGQGFVPYSVPLGRDAIADLEEVSKLEGGSGLAPVIEKDELLSLKQENTEDAMATPVPTPTPFPPADPTRLVIPKIELVAPVIPANSKKTWLAAVQYEQWMAPNEFAVGWHGDSAQIGAVGNTVLNGHHNIHGQVFRNLDLLEPGDEIIVYADGNPYSYIVVNKMILPEKKVAPEVRLENARWIMPSEDERLTLVTCWPFESNSHRLIIVAIPKQN